MRLKITSIVLLFSIMFSLYPGVISYAENNTSAEYTIQRDDASWYNENGELKLSQYFDKVVLEPTNDKYVRINSLIQQESDKFLADADEQIIFTKENPSPYDGWYSNYSDAIVTTNSNGILSIKTSYVWCMGGTVGYGDRGLNFNLNTGDVLSLTDVFSMNENEIEMYFKEQTKKYISDNPDKGWWNDNVQNAVSTVEAYTLEQFNYYIENDNIYLCYPKYELGPGGMGPVTVCCPITKPKKNITVVLNGQELFFGQPPVIKDGRTLVPMRAIFEAMGAGVEWDANTRTVISTKNDLSIKLSINDYVMVKNGVKIYLDVPAQLIGDYTMIPIRAVAEAFGANVEWDGETQTIYIISCVKQNAFIVNADADITGNDAALVRSILLENKLISVNEDNCHSAFEPSSETFHGIINQIVREAGDKDITYFFYSGHGGSDGHISPTYNNTTHNSSFTLTPQGLIDTLNNIPGTIVIILDSCYSGAINNLYDLNREKFKIITSSSASEYSNTSDLAVIPFISSEQLGRFTEVFLNALGGLEGTNPIYNAITKRDGKVKADYNNDNNVTLQELYQYVSENIDDSQTPSVSDEYDNTVIYSY